MNAKYLRALTTYLLSTIFFSKAVLRETEQSEIYWDMGICVVAAVSLICFVRQ